MEYKRASEKLSQEQNIIENDPESRFSSLLSKRSIVTSKRKYKSVGYCQLFSRRIFLITSFSAFFSYFSYWL